MPQPRLGFSTTRHTYAPHPHALFRRIAAVHYLRAASIAASQGADRKSLGGWGFGFGGLGSRVQGLGFGDLGLAIRVWGFRV